jgi:hypothetical protein
MAIYSCSQHSVVTARPTLVQPDSIIPLSLTLTLFFLVPIPCIIEYIKDIYSVRSTFTFSVTVDVFKIKIKQMMMSAQCCASNQHASSPPHHLASNEVPSAQSREHGYHI